MVNCDAIEELLSALHRKIAEVGVAYVEAIADRDRHRDRYHGQEEALARAADRIGRLEACIDTAVEIGNLAIASGTAVMVSARITVLREELLALKDW